MSGRGGERGVALISAIMIILTLSLISAAMARWGFVLWQGARVESSTSRTLLELEGASSRALWLLLLDLEQNRLRTPLDEVNYDSSERFVGDGVLHYLSLPGLEYDFEVRILDAGTGVPLTVASIERLMNAIVESVRTIDEREQATALRHRVMDFIDSDSIARENGLEAREYTLLGHTALPLNAAPQDRSYLAMIPGFTDLIPANRDGVLDYFAADTNAPGLNFFSAAPELVATLLEASEIERGQLEEARRNVYERGYPVKFTLGMLNPPLYERLTKLCSLEESGVYLITVTPMLESGRRGRVLELTVSFKLTRENDKAIIDYSTLQIHGVKYR